MWVEKEQGFLKTDFQIKKEIKLCWLLSCHHPQGELNNRFNFSFFLILSGKIALERERLGAERKERERRFELESQERQVILDLLKEKVLKGWQRNNCITCILMSSENKSKHEIWGEKCVWLFQKEEGKQGNRKWKDQWLLVVYMQVIQNLIRWTVKLVDLEWAPNETCTADSVA